MFPWTALTMFAMVVFIIILFVPLHFEIVVISFFQGVLGSTLNQKRLSLLTTWTMLYNFLLGVSLTQLPLVRNQ